MPNTTLFPLPPSAVSVSADVAFRDEGDVRVVFLRGVPFQCYARDDRVTDAVTIATLAEAGLAKPGELEAALGRDRTTIHRDRVKLREGGVGALVPSRPGPKGPWKTGGTVAERARTLRVVEKRTRSEIATRLGLSLRTIDRLLKGLDAKSEPAISQLTLSFGEPASADDSVPAVAPTQPSEPPAAPPISEPPPETSPVDDASPAEPSPAPEPLTAAEEPAPPPGSEPLSAAEEPAPAPLPAAEEPAAPPGSEPLPAAEPAPASELLPAAEEPALAPNGPPLGDGVAPDRSVDRGLAAAGAIVEASVELRAGENLRFLGVLLALPALASLGLLDAFRGTYGSLRPAFYGLRATVLTLFYMALLRIRSVEQLKGFTPAALGRLLGLDRAPEVKTLRRKLIELALRSKAADLIRGLARRWAALDSDATGILYVDGHVRVYHGKHSLPKAHVAQLRLSVPATTDYWVNDRDGDPLFLVTAPANRGMVAMLPDLVREIRSTVGERRVTVVFDRGGYSPALFQRLSEHCDVLTYWKGDVDPIPLDRFVEEELRIDGRVERYKIAERLVTLGGFEMRHVAVLRPDGKQTPILTTRRDWRRAYVAYRMFSRWRQENYFRYMGEEFSLDALLEHAVEPDDPKRLVPNPERKRVGELRAKARADVAALERAYGRALDENDEARRPTSRGVKIANGKTGRALRAAREKAAALHAQWGALPERVPLDTLRPAAEIVRLAPERKLAVDAVRTTAYRAESTLLAILSDTSFTRDQDEGRAFLQNAFRLSGGLDIAADGSITVTLEPMSAPRMTRALTQVCERLTATATRFPGTSSKITYRVRGGDCRAAREG